LKSCLSSRVAVLSNLVLSGEFTTSEIRPFMYTLLQQYASLIQIYMVVSPHNRIDIP
jgi:hypothetical protein